MNLSRTKMGFTAVDPSGEWDIAIIAPNEYDAKVFALAKLAPQVYKRNMNPAEVERHWQEAEKQGFTIQPVSMSLITN